MLWSGLIRLAWVERAPRVAPVCDAADVSQTRGLPSPGSAWWRRRMAAFEGDGLCQVVQIAPFFILRS
jgi:hypothetical protein